MSAVSLLILYLLLAITVSFTCSIVEAVLLSTPISFITMKEDEGWKGAALFKKYKTDMDRPIAAILSLNTIAHTVGAAGVGAQAAVIFNNAYFGLVSAITTFLILVFSEIIPKTLGTSYWKRMTTFTAYAIRMMIFITCPLVILFEGLTKLFSPK